MGLWTYGIDISRDFVELAKKRLKGDELLKISSEEVESRFSVIDIERTGLPPHLRGTFDIVWLESCLHHFVDPVSVLRNLAEVLKPDGLIVLIEFENRQGAIKDEYMSVMRKFDTLERPYAREELENALHIVGLAEYEFLGTVNGWFSPHDPLAPQMGEILVNSASQMNLAICAKQKGRLNEIFPHRLKQSSIKFGKGFYPNEGGFRWCAPTSEFTSSVSLTCLQLQIHSTLPSQRQQSQVVVAYGTKGELGRLTLSPDQTCGKLLIGDVERDECITLVSAEAFRPSWSGSPDKRLLSFWLKIDE
jgi:hypothetical protein